MADHFELPFGRSIQGDSSTWYKTVQRLGAGGTAATFLVVATSGISNGCFFALKVFRRLSKPERRDPFLREIEFLKQSRHPSVMAVFDEGEYYGKHPFVVAEYLPQTLQRVIRADGASTAEKLGYALQMISALAFLNTLNPPVIHRDIKPQNIFVKGRSCILGDFGLMKLQHAESNVDLPLFKESVGAGMPFRYRTPNLVEYFTSGTPPTTKSDIYQLGLVLAELFTGKNPQKPATDFETPVELSPLGVVRGALGRNIANLIVNMLDFDPQNRQPAARLLDAWQGLFFSAAERTSALEGTVF